MKGIVRLIVLWIMTTIPMVCIGWFIGNKYGFGLYGPSIVFEVMVLSIIFIYFSSDNVILRRYQAKRISEENHITRTVEELAKKSEIPVPKIYLAETLMPAIFSIGRSPRHASIVLTDSLINLLDMDELVTVLAHEMYHIKSGDTLLGTIAAVIASPLTAIINTTSSYSFFVATIVAPPAALIIRLTVPRSREHFADLKSVDIVGKPLKLISALSKIQERLDSHDYRVNPSHVHLFILNPLRDNTLKMFGRNLPSYNKLFNTHPPINERLNILGITRVTHTEVDLNSL